MLDLDRMFAPDSQGVHCPASHESFNQVVHMHQWHHEMTMLFFPFPDDEILCQMDQGINLKGCLYFIGKGNLKFSLSN